MNVQARVSSLPHENRPDLTPARSPRRRLLQHKPAGLRDWVFRSSTAEGSGAWGSTLPRSRGEAGKGEMMA